MDNGGDDATVRVPLGPIALSPVLVVDFSRGSQLLTQSCL